MLRGSKEASHKLSTSAEMTCCAAVVAGAKSAASVQYIGGPNGGIWGIVRPESVACHPSSGRRCRGGGQPVDFADNDPVRPVPARAPVHAGSRPGMAAKA